jgi:hypothetical protein
MPAAQLLYVGPGLELEGRILDQPSDPGTRPTNSFFLLDFMREECPDKRVERGLATFCQIACLFQQGFIHS